MRLKQRIAERTSSRRSVGKKAWWLVEFGQGNTGGQRCCSYLARTINQTGKACVCITIYIYIYMLKTCCPGKSFKYTNAGLIERIILKVNTHSYFAPKLCLDEIRCYNVVSNVPENAGVEYEISRNSSAE